MPGSLDSAYTAVQAELACCFRASVEEQRPAFSSISVQEVGVGDHEDLGSAIRLVAQGESLELWAITVRVPPEMRLVVHGHSATFWIGSLQVAELLLQSSAAAGLRLSPGDRGQSQLEVFGDAGSCCIELRFEDFQLKDRGVGRGGLNWRRHESRRSFNYLMERGSAAGSGKLLVVFSALGAEYDFTFNYRAAAAPSDVNKVFILDDFGTQGSYYWLDHGDESIFRGTQELLARIVNEVGVSLGDVIFAGSSKGGTAALLHGVTLGVGKVVVGAPQYKVGDYLSGAAPQVLKFMTGGVTEEHRSFLNASVKEILGHGQRRTRIRVLVGTDDHHYPNHVRPLLVDAQEAGYTTQEVLLAGVPHEEVGKVFRHLLAAELADLESGEEQQPLPYVLSRAGDSVKLRCWAGHDARLGVHLLGRPGLLGRIFGRSVLLERRTYSGQLEYVFQVPSDRGQVRARVFRRDGPDAAVQAFTTHWI